MSASGKLRALEEATIFDRVMRDDEDEMRIERLGDALPQIRAVVEAAEYAYYYGPRNEEHQAKLDAALAALDEALP